MNQNFADLNRTVFVALESLGPISTSMVSMFGTDDPHSRHPFLRFRYSGVPKDSPVYEQLSNAISKFRGHLHWGLFTRGDSENYIIAPILLDAHDYSKMLPSVEMLIEALGVECLEKKIDAAIMDTSGLCEGIVGCRDLG